MMWIDGVNPLRVIEAYVGEGHAAASKSNGLMFGSWPAILIIAITANVITNLKFPAARTLYR